MQKTFQLHSGLCSQAAAEGRHCWSGRESGAWGGSSQPAPACGPVAAASVPLLWGRAGPPACWLSAPLAPGAGLAAAQAPRCAAGSARSSFLGL